MYSSRIALVLGHIIFWFLNYWLVAIRSNFNWNGFTYTSGSFSYAYAYGLFFNAVVFYAQVFWLFPWVYQRKKKWQFYLFTIIVITLITILETYCDYNLLGIYGVYNEPISGSFNSNFIVHIIYTAAGFYYALRFEYKKAEKAKQKLIEETYKSELKYLKAQLNPHFLFNGINSVYHLIGKNDALAKETLLQFSGLLRYQLYESNAHIALEKELDYVAKYIKIEATRRGADIRLVYTIESENPKVKIAPLLLIPFIENAFKHCSNHMDSSTNTISISIKEAEGKLTLNVKNSYDPLTNEKEVGGVGLTNVRKRLSLLYPDTHQLTISKELTHHIANLSIRLQHL